MNLLITGAGLIGVHAARQLAETLKALKPGLTVTLPAMPANATLAPLNVEAPAHVLGFRAGYSLLDGLREYDASGIHPEASE